MKLPNPIKSGIASACFTFVGLFIPALLGWFSKVSEWASSSGAKPLPGLSSLGYAAVAAAMAALTGLVTFVFRWAQGRFSWVPGQPPQFQGSK